MLCLMQYIFGNLPNLYGKLWCLRSNNFDLYLGLALCIELKMTCNMTHAVHLLHVTKFVNVQILELPKLDWALKFLVNFGNFQISMHMLSKFVCLQIWQFAKNVLYNFPNLKQI